MNNNYSTGSSALVRAATLVCVGDVHSILPFSSERMSFRKLRTKSTSLDHPSLVPPLLSAADRASPNTKLSPLMPRVFGAATESTRKCWGRVGHLAKIGDFCILVCFYCGRVRCAWCNALSRPRTMGTLSATFLQFWASYDEAAVLDLE